MKSWIVLVLCTLPLVIGCTNPIVSSDNGGGTGSDDPDSPPFADIAPPPIDGIMRDGVELEEPDEVEYDRTGTYQLLPRPEEVEEEFYYRAVDELPQWIALDNESGEVTVDSTEAELSEDDEESATVQFYTSFNEDKDDDRDDGTGTTKDEPFEWTFTVYWEGDPIN